MKGSVRRVPMRTSLRINPSGKKERLVAPGVGVIVEPNDSGLFMAVRGPARFAGRMMLVESIRELDLRYKPLGDGTFELVLAAP